jgi:hypothetical protein
MIGFASNIIKFEGHNMTIVEMDGVNTVPVNASKILNPDCCCATIQCDGHALLSAKRNYGIFSNGNACLLETQ